MNLSVSAHYSNLNFKSKLPYKYICMCCFNQDFEMNSELKGGVISLLEEVLRDPDLLPQERKATTNILRYKGIAVNIIVYFFLSTHCPRIFFYNRQGQAIDCAYKIDLVTMLSPISLQAETSV